MSEKKNILLGCGAVLVLLVAGAMYFRTSSGALPTISKFRAAAVALDTKQELTVSFKPDEPPPWVNPATGKRTVYPWWYCLDCKYRFVPPLVPNPNGGPPSSAGRSNCPHCGSANTTGWRPEELEPEKPAGDAPLPTLPG